MQALCPQVELFQQLRVLSRLGSIDVHQSTRKRRLLARFILQHRLHPSEMTQRVFVQHLDPFAMEFIDALCMTDKRISRIDWLWRYTLLTGTVMLAMTDVGPKNRMSVLSNGQADASRDDELTRHLAEYLCRALRSS